MPDFLIESLAMALQSLDIGSEAFKLTLGCHRLLQKHLNALETFLLVVELASDNFVAHIAVLACLLSQI